MGVRLGQDAEGEEEASVEGEGGAEAVAEMDTEGEDDMMPVGVLQREGVAVAQGAAEPVPPPAPSAVGVALLVPLMLELELKEARDEALGVRLARHEADRVGDVVPQALARMEGVA